MDPYNLYFTCYLNNAGHYARRRAFLKHMNKITGKELYNLDGKLLHAYTFFFPLFLELPQCAQFNDTGVYLNREDVRHALHISSHVQKWAACK